MPTSQRIKVLRVIARLNVGGPAHHVCLLSGQLDPARYETLLVAGRVGPGEGSFAELAARHGATLVTVDSLHPEVSLLDDVRALYAVLRLIRRYRPHIVHTHTAKAGMLGRLAALLSGVRPIVVHTYHGHVLEGYFGRCKSTLFLTVERWLARHSTRLVAVSTAIVDDLVRLGVSAREHFIVIPLGLELDPYLSVQAGDGSLRRELAAGEDELLVVSIGRLVPIKRLDVLLRAVAEAVAAGLALRVAIVGDGTGRHALEALTRQLGLESVVHFLGFRKDLRPILADADVAMLTSDNEGTPVSLIEAAAAARPAVSTAAGGVQDVVVTERTGFVVPRGDVDALAGALARMADGDLRRRMGIAAREHVRARYGSARLLRDVEALYAELLERRRERGEVSPGRGTR